MSIKFTKLSSILLITIAMSTAAPAVKAEKAETEHSILVTEVFEDAYFENSPNTFKESSILGQLNTIFGFRGFPDNHLVADGEALDDAFQKFGAKQYRVGSPVKTKDLTNPYSTSLQENPSYIGY